MKTSDFLRIDADVHESLKDEVAEDEKESFGKMADSLVEIFRKELNDDKLDVKVEKLKDDKVASMAVLSEENRRMEEMMKMYGMGGMDTGMFGGQASLILNADHPLVQYVVENKEGENVELICKQLYDLALLAHKPLSPQEMTAFVQRSNQIMMSFEQNKKNIGSPKKKGIRTISFSDSLLYCLESFASLSLSHPMPVDETVDVIYEKGNKITL